MHIMIDKIKKPADFSTDSWLHVRSHAGTF